MAPMRLVAVAVFAAVFALLWWPLGQAGYLAVQWPTLGLAAALALTFALAILAAGGIPMRAREMVMLTLLVLYLFHQFEEHGIDLLGERFAFEKDVNALVGARFGCAPGSLCPFDPASIFAVNTALVWWTLALLVLVGTRSLVADLCGVSLLFVNALTHVGAAVATREYNPGLATALGLFLPGSLFAVWALRQTYAGGLFKGLTLGLAYGVFLHAALVATVYLEAVKGLLPMSALLPIFVTIGTLPALIAVTAGRRR